MKNLRIINIILSLITATLFNCESIKPLEIPVAKLGYSQGNTLVSRGFDACSAVVLDYKNQALMAHATTYSETWGIKNDYVHAGNVVDALSEQAKTRGINPKNCVALINAGSEESLERIIHDLKEKDIPISEAKLDKGFRDIAYNPINNSFSVTHRGSPQRGELGNPDFYPYSGN